MELNYVTTGIELIGTTIKAINIENSIVDIEQDAKRNFGLNINEPCFSTIENRFCSQMSIDFEVEMEQSEEQKCKIELTLEGAFISNQGVEEDAFKKMVIINGAAAIIGIARGKIEAISSNVFNNGKVVIPFVNVVDYYKSVAQDEN